MGEQEPQPAFSLEELSFRDWPQLAAEVFSGLPTVVLGRREVSAIKSSVFLR
jgi:hypothetical protein